MLDNSMQENREERYGKTERKHVSLLTETVEGVQEYADRHGLYFSVAVESLVLIGLGSTTAETLPRLVTSMLERALNQQFNRFAKLIATGAISAEEINHKADVLLLQMIRREAQIHPDTFIEEMQVSTDPYDLLDCRVRQIRDDICEDAHAAAVAHLKKPMSHIGPLWQVEADDEQ